MVDFSIKDAYNNVIQEITYKSEASIKYKAPVTGKVIKYLLGK